MHQKAKKNDLYKLARFVVSENYLHHDPFDFSKAGLNSEIETVFQEDVSLYADSDFYVAVKDGTIVGSVKITLCNDTMTLPMEKLFGISYNDLPFTDQKVLQVGRLCISKTLGTEGLPLLKQLLTLAIIHVCRRPGGIMIAECDKKLLRVLNLLGIKTKLLGAGVLYLGSVTIPIYSREEWLKTFLKGNPYVGQFNNVRGCNTTS